jgi:uncharacterized SAM-binding protein YcdF (DUF218 family)
LNQIAHLFGIEAWKPALTALLLPPVPWLLLIAIGTAMLLRARRIGGTLLIGAGAALIWLSACSGVGHWLSLHAVTHPPPLSSARIDALKAAVTAQPGAARHKTAIVVLGGGVERIAPEYGVATLTAESLERLRYGIWLARRTGAPLAFSGGTGWAQSDATPEALVAARVAVQEFGRPLSWIEDRSRDTRENAVLSVPLVKQAGVDHVLVVTHGWHMQRALGDFEQAAAGALRIEAAPMGLAPPSDEPLLQWLPSQRGQLQVRRVLREWLGRMAGA